MHFDWFFPVLMIYWRTKAQVTSPLTIFASSLNLTNRFQVAVHLFSNKSQMMSKCGKNKKVAHKAQPIVSLMFFTTF